MKIVFYLNCLGEMLSKMFETHFVTRFDEIYFVKNYINLDHKELSDEHTRLLETCDVFIYQPFNRIYDDTQYDITYIKTLLKKDVIILRVNYYRFHGFWYKATYIPYESFGNFLFNPKFGIYEPIKYLESQTKESVTNFINSIDIPRNELIEFYNNQLKKFKEIDDNSDVDMYSFFIQYHKTIPLFNDPYHPTLFFIYEIFRQLVFKLYSVQLPFDDSDFCNAIRSCEITHWVTPILPIMYSTFGLKLPRIVECFHPIKIPLDVYEYYYIRLSKYNFQDYLFNIFFPKYIKNTYIPGDFYNFFVPEDPNWEHHKKEICSILNLDVPKNQYKFMLMALNMLTTNNIQINEYTTLKCGLGDVCIWLYTFAKRKGCTIKYTFYTIGPFKDFISKKLEKCGIDTQYTQYVIIPFDKWLKENFKSE